MTLKTDIQDAVAGAFDALSDLSETATYREQTGSGYNTATGTATGTYTDHIITGIVAEFTRFDVASGTAQADDKRLILSAKGLTFTPKVSDRVTLNGVSYDIVSVEFDPAAAVFDLQLRK